MATTFSKAAAILTPRALVLMVGVVGATEPCFYRMHKDEMRVYLAVAAAIPFLVVRMLYALLADFAINPTVGIWNGHGGGY